MSAYIVAVLLVVLIIGLEYAIRVYGDDKYNK